MPPRVTQAMRDYWLDRFTVDEIRTLAGRVWTDDERAGDSKPRSG